MLRKGRVDLGAGGGYRHTENVALVATNGKSPPCPEQLRIYPRSHRPAWRITQRHPAEIRVQGEVFAWHITRKVLPRSLPIELRTVQGSRLKSLEQPVSQSRIDPCLWHEVGKGGRGHAGELRL